MLAPEPVAIQRNASQVAPMETWTSPKSEECMEDVNKKKINILPFDFW